MENIRLAHSEYLNLLWLLIPATALFLLYLFLRRRAYKRLGNKFLIRTIFSRYTQGKAITRFCLFSLSYVFLCIALANPQTGSRMEKVKREGIDVAVAMDISRSMNAQDLKPSRIDRTRQFTSRLIDELASDKVSLVVFAGHAYVQMPLTLDHAAAKLFLSTISTELAPTQGTAIGEAIEEAKSSFRGDKKGSRVIIILTDGEDHEGNVLDVAEKAAQEGITIYTIGVGTPDGSPIPLYAQNGMSGFLKDNRGEVVISKLNDLSLQKIASAGGGKYFRLTENTAVLEELSSDLAKLKKSGSEEQLYSDYDDQFQIFLALAILILLIDSLIIERKSYWLSKLGLFRERNAVPLLLIMIAICGAATSASAQSNRSSRAALRKGNQLYKDNKFPESDPSFAKARAEDPKSWQSWLGTGDAQYRQKKYVDAQKSFESGASITADKDALAKLYHNIGNTLLEQKKYDEAIEAYKKSLKANADDDNTRYNLSYARMKQQEEKKNQQQNKDKKDQNKDSKDNKDKKDNKGDNKDNQDNKGDQKKDKDNKGDSKSDKDKDQKKDKDEKKPDQGDNKENPQDKKDGKGKPQQAQISEQEADRILNALKNQEQKVQKRLLLKKKDTDNNKIEKQW